MIERLARALYEHAQIEEPQDGGFELERDYWIAHARVGIEAMEEPTEAMLSAGADFEIAGYDHNMRVGECGAAGAWRLMTTAALK